MIQNDTKMTFEALADYFSISIDALRIRYNALRKADITMQPFQKEGILTDSELNALVLAYTSGHHAINEKTAKAAISLIKKIDKNEGEATSEKNEVSFEFGEVTRDNGEVLTELSEVRQMIGEVLAKQSEVTRIYTSPVSEVSEPLSEVTKETSEAINISPYIPIVIMIVALFSISLFQMSMTNGALWHVGEKLGFDTLKENAWLAAFGFSLGGFALSIFVKNDEWNDPNFQYVLGYSALDTCFNLSCLVDTTHGVSIGFLGVIISLATPFVQYNLSRTLNKTVREL